MTLRRVPPESLQIAQRHQSLGRILWRLAFHVPTTPLPPPSLPHDLPRMFFPLAMLALVRFALLRLEFALSPAGELRGVLRILLRLVILASAFLLALAAVLGVASLVTAACAVISAHLLTIALNLFWTLVTVLGSLVVLIVILLILAAALQFAGRK